MEELTGPRFEVEAEARGEFAAVTIRSKHWQAAPLFAFRTARPTETLPFPGVPSRGRVIIGSAGIVGIEELAQAFEAAAVALRAAISRAQGQTP
jgi:hypothetical protein